jgi:hypothetical protein
MENDLHNRAQLLIDQSMVTGISDADQSWLQNHTGDCAKCRNYAEISARVIRGLGSFSFEIEPGLNVRVQNAVTQQARALAVERDLYRSFLKGFVIALALTCIGSVAVWKSVSWVAAQANLTLWVWHAGVVFFWALPSLSVALLLIVVPRYLLLNVDAERRSA